MTAWFGLDISRGRGPTVPSLGDNTCNPLHSHALQGQLTRAGEGDGGLVESPNLLRHQSSPHLHISTSEHSRFLPVVVVLQGCHHVMIISPPPPLAHTKYSPVHHLIDKVVTATICILLKSGSVLVFACLPSTHYINCCL